MHMIQIEEIPVERIDEFWEIHIRYLIDDGIATDEEVIQYFQSAEYRNIIKAHMIRCVDRHHMVYFLRGGIRIGAAQYNTYQSEDGKCFILDFWVFPEFRGKGTGQECFEALRRYTGLDGARYYELNCTKENAHRFWSSLGFTDSGLDEYDMPLMQLRSITCYIVRHGKDDETIRGGWSNQPLTEEGIRQAEKLSETMSGLDVAAIYSSDLRRAMQTAQILAEKLHLPVISLPQFREVNNGELAGMKNMLALERYPGLFWNQLGWEQCYPGGESPKQFYERIHAAWESFSAQILSKNENVVLVTHGGVIHVLRSILENRPYSNQEKQRNVRYTEVIALSYQNGVWEERL